LEWQDARKQPKQNTIFLSRDLALRGLFVGAVCLIVAESVSTGCWVGTASYAASLSFASRLMNGKSGVFLPFNGKYLNNSLG